MVIKNIFGFLKTCCLIGFLIIGLAGCSEKITNNSADGNVKIRMSARISNIEMSQLINSFVLTVDAEDFTAPVIVPLQLEGSFLVGEVTIPAGAYRHFLVQALDALEAVIYQGEAYADVVYNETVDVDINLFPIVPLMKIVPRFGSIAMGTSFTADVYIYNVPNVRYISFDFAFATNDNLVYPDSIMEGVDLEPNSLSYESGGNTASIWIYQPNSVDPLVDAEGNAHLATFYFRSHSDTVRDYDTASLVITPYNLDRSVGDVSDPFPIYDSLYLEEAMFELYRDTGLR
jgi:hypothetical protein